MLDKSIVEAGEVERPKTSVSTASKPRSLELVLEPLDYFLASKRSNSLIDERLQVIKLFFFF
jgi:hypothetical protein